METKPLIDLNKKWLELYLDSSYNSIWRSRVSQYKSKLLEIKEDNEQDCFKFLIIYD